MDGKSIKKRINKKSAIFYYCMMAYPILQFCIFYIGVNFNSILLSFQEYDALTMKTTWTWDTIGKAFDNLVSSANLLFALKNSLIGWVVGFAISLPLALFFSYYIYKQFIMHKFFRIMLFLPSIISSIVMVAIFNFFVNEAIPEIALKFFNKRMGGLITKVEGDFTIILIYNVLIGFGTNVLMYTNSMKEISPDLVEAAHLDGATGIKEFLYITFPGVFPTISTFIIVGVAGIFTNQLNLYSFYGNEAIPQLQTYGYFLYKSVQIAGTNRAEYPLISAYGLLMTIVAIPLTFLIKTLLNKFGPKED